MNKKGSIGQTINREAIFLIILAVFVALVLLFLGTQRSGASIWGDYYAREIAKVINQAKPGDQITLDVGKAVSIALGNHVSLNTNSNDIFHFQNNEVCVKLDSGKMSCYAYYNNVVVSDDKINLPENTITFKIGAGVSK